jgi:hypothetical protein
MGALRLGRQQVVAFRSTAQHLDDRLPSNAVAEAAAGGLQDTVPRAALFGLHARLLKVGPDTWEDPSLVQTYGPRGAVYVLPRVAVAAFTRGLLPREAGARAGLEAVADRVVGALADGEIALRKAALASRQDPNVIRLASRTGRYVIRWDTTSLKVRRNETPPNQEGDEDARVELAERFLHWHGPSDAVTFAKWAGVDKRDVAVTWAQLADRMVPVEVDGHDRFLLEEDLAAAQAAVGVDGSRLLPPNDALLAVDRALVEPDATRRASAFPAYAQPGVVLVDGRLEGTWRRQARRLQLDLGTRDRSTVERIMSEAESAADPLGGRVDIEVIDAE